MKPEDDEPSPSDDELREAAALADALEKDARPGGAAPADALETAALLRQTRAPLAVPRAHEPIATAQAVQALESARRRGRFWIAVSIAGPAVVAGMVLLSLVTPIHSGRPPVAIRPPVPTPGLLSAQAEATRGGRAALARLDEEMRSYRRRYHADLSRARGVR